MRGVRRPGHERALALALFPARVDAPLGVGVKSQVRGQRRRQYDGAGDAGASPEKLSHTAGSGVGLKREALPPGGMGRVRFRGRVWGGL